MSIDVHTPVYEGPLDLLLHLILREQVDIYEVSLTSIIDAYLAELERLLRIPEPGRGLDTGPTGLDLETATEFLLIAATLVELKTRRLLPVEEVFDLDEELALWEQRDILLARLVECKTFKNAAAHLVAAMDDGALRFARRCGPDERFVDLAPDLLAGVTAEDLRAAYVAAVTPRPVPRVDVDHVAPVRASVVDAVVELTEELPAMGRTTFRALTESFVERLEVVVRFLAVLELYKSGLVDLDQSGNFGELTIEWVGETDGDPVMVAIDTYEG